MATAEFKATLTSPAAARTWVAALLELWEVPSVPDAAVLLTSELVANAVIHASSRPTVTISVAGGLLEVGVSDRESRLPPFADHGTAWPPLAGDVALAGDGGRGLLLVEALAEDWGAVRLAAGKHVWFRMPVDDWRHRHACLCHEPHPDRVLLESGRYALHMAGPGAGMGGRAEAG